MKGADETEDRSFHFTDGITGQPISSKRRRAAKGREEFYGVHYANADDVFGVLGGTDDEGEHPRDHGYA